mmetsp:Transcript_10974/g.33664  ORF Transcript_10974/g.33664 Transcript_10974/m.33664 type:complete len:250 (+) Transcript_10974:63-812(+)
MEENDEEGLLTASFFANDQTVTLEQRIGDEVEVFLASPSACTDHDLTGQVVWPVARLLALYVYSERSFFHSKRVLELGAGVGLTGLVAARYAQKSVLTDGSESVLKILHENVAQARRTLGRDVEAAALNWEAPLREKQMPAIIEKLGGMPDIILGADVVQWPEALEPLMDTVSELLSRGNSSAYFACGLVARSKWLRNELFRLSSLHNLQVSVWPHVEEAIRADEALRSSNDRASMEILLFRHPPSHVT